MPFCRGVTLALVSACQSTNDDLVQGYIEGEFVYVASPLPGELETLAVERGAQVKEGDLLFSLESGSEKAARDEADRKVTQARANLEDAKLGHQHCGKFGFCCSDLPVGKPARSCAG
jgi:HlyD family secretion protein